MNEDVVKYVQTAHKSSPDSHVKIKPKQGDQYLLGLACRARLMEKVTRNGKLKGWALTRVGKLLMEVLDELELEKEKHRILTAQLEKERVLKSIDTSNFSLEETETINVIKSISPTVLIYIISTIHDERITKPIRKLLHCIRKLGEQEARRRKKNAKPDTRNSPRKGVRGRQKQTGRSSTKKNNIPGLYD